jgi:alkylated DNA repair dioxygenase AlkB
MSDLTWQPSLFDGAADEGDAVNDGAASDAAGGAAGASVWFDDTFAKVVRRDLGEGAWVDHQPGWVRGADRLFAQLLDTTPWAQHRRRMYERTLPEPRLTCRWVVGQSDHDPPRILVEMAEVLSARYGVEFTQIGANLYRDGADSVAWHGDRIARELPEATVALISLGEPRPFRLRPKGGGPSIAYLPGRGDLLVMGGSCQRTWDHAVPKVRHSGPRMSVQFRHVYDRDPA